MKKEVSHEEEWIRVHRNGNNMTEKGNSNTYKTLIQDRGVARNFLEGSSKS